MNLVQMLSASLKDLELVKLSKLTSHQIEHVTCLECCKYYIAPETAACGHTLCHTCWRGRRTCPVCAASLDRKTLKINLQLQILTDHVQVLGESFEKLFNMKLDEFNLDTPDELGSEKDPNRNVKDWLTSSQNHFSAPVIHSQQSTEEQVTNPVEISASNIQIHTHITNKISPPKVVHIPPPQHDWDKIEPMPDLDDCNKNKENIIGPMDIEPFFLDDNEYTSDKPRRSSRKRDLKNYDGNVHTHDLPTTKHSSRDSSGENERSEKSKQTWNNVKKMRKEFSKLNKKNKSKLNVSIEMVKKSHNLKQVSSIPVTSTPEIVNIDDNTPYNTNKEIGVKKKNNVDVDHDAHLHNIVLSDGDISKVINKAHGDNFSIEYTGNKHNDKHDEHNDLLNSRKNTIKNSVYDRDGNINKETQNKSKNEETIPIRLPFIKKGCLVPRSQQIFNDIITNNTTYKPTSMNTDDIEITIKVGNTIANILIKKKESDIEVKVNTDREVQTSPNNDGLNNNLSSQNSQQQNIEINVNNNVVASSKSVANEANRCPDVLPAPNVQQSISTKKNTASAETTTAQFEITESVEKELSNIMECEETSNEKGHDKEMCSIQSTKINTATQKQSPVIQNKNIMDKIEIDHLNYLDIFGSGSVKESNVQPLKEPAHSEILMSTVHSKFKTQKIAEKRNRDCKDDEADEVLPNNKKIKTTQKNNLKENVEPDSEPINYDTVINQVFANIDADIEETRKSQQEHNTNTLNTIKNDKYVVKQPKSVISQTQQTKVNKNHVNEVNIADTPNTQDYFNQKQSENVFSITEKEYDNVEIMENVEIRDLLTPVLYRNVNVSQGSQTDNSGRMSKSTKKSLQDNYDSDKSVVEETPQKNISFSNLKRASTSKTHQSQENLIETKKIDSKSSREVKSIVNLTDSTAELNRSSKDVTVVSTTAKKTLETPLTISKFADQIKHKSTPVARKSLHFDNEDVDDDDPEQTLCPTSSVIAKTTQEKEFLRKAFEKTPSVMKPAATKDFGINPNKKLCLAGSCLPSQDITKLKYLCNERNWTYVDKYTKELTHLVVGVDEENKSQRSVKYMCALAASKWIVSFEWAKKCLLAKGLVDEDHFEALDSTGEPGPNRSRVAKKKLFQGITFYCMPPFSVLDVETLKNMLADAGGRVVNEIEQVRVSPNSREPALLLAEPEHTQEDRFIYLTMELSVVPVNYEWVLNCLGSYTLSSIQELLLCPPSLLPPGTSKWPEVLLAQEYD